MIEATIFENPTGNVMTNKYQSLFSVEFKNVLITLNPSNFEAFCDFICYTDPHDLSGLVVTNSGKIILRPNNDRFCYVLLPSEFLELRELLDGARSILRMHADVCRILNSTEQHSKN